MPLGIEDGDEQQRGAHAPAPVLVPVLPLLWSCYRACYPPVLFSINADFMDISGRAAIKFPVLYRDEAKNARDANGSCTFANWRVEKGHRPAPARRQNEPEDSFVMAVVKRRSRNRNRRFAKTKPTDDPLVITVSYPRFVVARPPLPPPPQIVWCRRAKDSVTERIPSDPDKAMEGRASRPHKSRAHSFVQNEPELAHAELSWARAAPVRTQCSQ
jgi:hypothetical protein